MGIDGQNVERGASNFQGCTCIEFMTKAKIECEYCNHPPIIHEPLSGCQKRRLTEMDPENMKSFMDMMMSIAAKMGGSSGSSTQSSNLPLPDNTFTVETE